MPALAPRGRVISLILIRPVKHALPLLLAALIVRGCFAADNPFESGLAALKEGDFDKAISLFTEDIRLHPSNGAAFDNRGFAYLQKGDLDRAIADFTVPIRMRPDDPHPYSNRAHAYEKKGDYSRAIADYSRAIQLDPNRAEDYNNRGAIFGSQGQWDKRSPISTQRYKGIQNSQKRT